MAAGFVAVPLAGVAALWGFGWIVSVGLHVNLAPGRGAVFEASGAVTVPLPSGAVPLGATPNGPFRT